MQLCLKFQAEEYELQCLFSNIFIFGLIVKHSCILELIVKHSCTRVAVTAKTQNRHVFVDTNNFIGYPRIAELSLECLADTNNSPYQRGTHIDYLSLSHHWQWCWGATFTSASPTYPSSCTSLSHSAQTRAAIIGVRSEGCDLVAVS